MGTETRTRLGGGDGELGGTPRPVAIPNLNSKKRPNYPEDLKNTQNILLWIFDNECPELLIPGTQYPPTNRNINFIKFTKMTVNLNKTKHKCHKFKLNTIIMSD